MSPTFVIMLIVAIAVLFVFCIVYKYKLDQLTKENELLRQQADRQEARSENSEDADSPSAEAPLLEPSGAALLQRFAKEHGCKLEPIETEENNPWMGFEMRYQGGSFRIGVHDCEMMVHYPFFESIDYSPELYLRVLKLCYDFNDANRYFKLTCDFDKEKNILLFSLQIELINPPYDWFVSILNATWGDVNEIRQALDSLRKDQDLDSDSDEAHTKTNDSSADSSSAPTETQSDSDDDTLHYDSHPLRSVRYKSEGEA